MFKTLVYFKEIAKTRFRWLAYLKEVKALKKSDWFDAEFYKQNYQDVLETRINPYFHYIFFGKYESRVASKDYYQDFPVQKYRYQPIRTSAIKKAVAEMKTTPFFSVMLLVWDEATAQDVNRTVLSIQQQGYANYELLVGYSKSPHVLAVRDEQKTKSLADCTSYAPLLTMADGEYVVTLACGDTLTSDALFELAKRLEENPDICLIYADEDSVSSDGEYHSPHYKTDFNYQLLLSSPYMGSFVAFSKAMLMSVEKPFDASFATAAIYDACLKVVKKTDQIIHIPKVLNHVMRDEDQRGACYRLDVAENDDYQSALKNHLARTEQNAQVLPGKIAGTSHVQFDAPIDYKVSVIIPFKDNPALLETCVNSILDKTEHENYELILVSNNSEQEETFALLKALEAKDTRIKTCEYNKPFNFSGINNFAAQEVAIGDCFLFLNNDTEVITKGWLKSMLGTAAQPRTGAVTAKLLYANDTVQSAGIGISQTGEIIEYHKFFRGGSTGYFGRLVLAQDIGAVSGACLMVEKRKFLEVGGFDETGFPVTYNDIDICYRLKQKGYVSVLLPYITLYHYESTTRAKVFDRNASPEYRALMQRYGKSIEKGDCYYSSNFKQRGENFEIEQR
ncbi:MAG: glycosyltransferase family 2 protein [Eubacteriales bacterium]